MASGMWTAVSGANAQAHAVDTIANNLANVDTLGYKKDLPTFKEYLAKEQMEPEIKDVPRGPVTDKELNPLDGKHSAFVSIAGDYTDFKQGSLKVTQAPLDLAIEGNGFFEVATPQGIRFTRSGSFKIAQDGHLVTSEGYPVLTSQPLSTLQGGPAQANAMVGNQPGGQGSPDTQGRVPAGLDMAQIAPRMISVRDRSGGISVTESGELYVGQDKVADLSLAQFADVRKLKKGGNQTFENTDPANRISDPKAIHVHQGMLETSNVNPVEEMTNLIKAHRNYDQGMKALKTYGDMMQRESTDIGKL